MTLETMQPVKVERGDRHADLEGFSSWHDNMLESLLAVPVCRGAEKIGVLVVEHQRRNFFDEIDVLAMRAIASQLAGAVGNARFLIGTSGHRAEQVDILPLLESSEPLMGQVASYGYAFAPAAVYDQRRDLLEAAEAGSDSKYSLSEFHLAVRKTTEQIQKLQARFSQRLAEGASLIFAAHLMILKDKNFTRKMESLIRDGVSVPSAVKSVASHYIDLYESSSYSHIKEKADDVRDLAVRILKNLAGLNQDSWSASGSRIVVARELYPSDVLRLASEDIIGIVLIKGGLTSHTAIVARSLQIPVLIVNQPELLQLPDGTPLMMDAESGVVYINPSRGTIEQAKLRKQSLLDTRAISREMSPVTYSKDGIRIRLLANINLLNDLSIARDLKAEGIGLYRSEFPFLIRSAVPSEEEQFLIYRRLFTEMAGKEVTIRLLDIGGDKLPAYSDGAGEANPALGLRGLRFLFRHRSLLNQQLRAILRAAVDAENPRILLPMVTSLDDILKARQMVYNCRVELEHENIPHHRKPLIGALLELPCVLDIIDELTAEADFLSIGTNDFIQYMLGVDRTNEKVAEHYRPYHPAVVRSLSKIVGTAKAQDADISVCGELAHDPKYIPFLLGIGIRTFSVYPKFLPAVQEGISDFKISDAKIYAKRMLTENFLVGAEEALTRLTRKFRLDTAAGKGDDNARS
jgi:phosphotransferase system enzyme I (PtsP)